MNQQIGNVGLLNLLNATTESIGGIDRIENVGAVIYRQGSAHLLTALNIGNIGATVEVPEGYRFHNGNIHLNQAFLQSISNPMYLFVNGAVIVAQDVQTEQLKNGLLHLVVNGKIYSPEHLSGVIGEIISKGSFAIESYRAEEPRFENGKFTLTNSFLQSIEAPLYLIVNGLLTLSKDLNMDQFMEKIDKLRVNGKVSLYEEQEAFLYKKITSLAANKVEVIPSGFEVINKTLRLNSRSIRRFRQKRIYTKYPILIEKDVSREKLEEAITNIHSNSVIICPETLEDLIYELLALLDTEVLSYEQEYLFIEGEESWSKEQFQALDKPFQLIVDGKMILESDVDEDVLLQKVSGLDILGEVMIKEKQLKGTLQSLIRVNQGSIEEENNRDQQTALYNVGELSL